MKVTLTHHGWFGVCPVYLGDLDTEAPAIAERHPALHPLMLLSEALCAVAFWCISVMGREPPGWPLLVTGQLESPRVLSDEEPA